MFRWKAGASINETAMSRFSREGCRTDGWRWRRPLLWRPDSVSIGTYVISFRPHFRKSLIFEEAFLRTSWSLKTRRLGSLRKIVSRRFDGIELPKIYCSHRTCGNSEYDPGRNIHESGSRKHRFPLHRFKVEEPPRFRGDDSSQDSRWHGFFLLHSTVNISASWFMLQTIYIILYKNITPVYHEIDRN